MLNSGTALGFGPYLFGPGLLSTRVITNTAMLRIGSSASNTNQPLNPASCRRRTETAKPGMMVASTYRQSAPPKTTPRAGYSFNEHTVKAAYSVRVMAELNSVNVQYSLRRARPLK